MEPRQQTYYNKNAVSVKEIGYQEDKNYPSRQKMEDCNIKLIQKKLSSTTIPEMDQDSSPSLMDMEAAKSANTAPPSCLMYLLPQSAFLARTRSRSK